MLESEQNGAGAEDRTRQRDDHRVSLAPPIATDVLASHVDVTDVRRHRNFPLSGRRTDDEIVDQHAAIRRARLERVEVKDVRLDALAECLDLQPDLPCAFTQTECLLQSGGFLGEKRHRHLGHAGCFASD